MSRLLGEEGEVRVLMGNEAIARGVIEAGADVVVGYPGTPSSEVIMSLQPISRELDMYVEWAVNEKVALEIATGAAFAGARAMATMKAPGLNVAADALMSVAYSGVNGALVIYVADDPGPHTTQTEQDSRYYARIANLPMVEPSTPSEAKEFTVKAFELSERTGLPVILRTTTRVSHSSSAVTLGGIKPRREVRQFVREPERYIRASMSWNLSRHRWLDVKLREVLGVARELSFDIFEGEGNMGIVCSGVSYCYVKEALASLGEEAKVFRAGLLNPLDEEGLKRWFSDVERVVVVEELQPFLEERVRGLLRVPVLGKRDGLFPLEGEYTPLMVERVLAGLFGEVLPESKEEVSAPPRPPPMCPGCPHRSTYLALLKALKELGYSKDEVPVMGDIGCYALSLEPPLEAIWTEHCMGASISLAAGLKIGGLKGPVVATIGDSTFFHNGIQPLLEVAHKGVPVLVLILDNGAVAMTGHQSTPEWEVTESGRRTRRIRPEDIVRALGLPVEVVDPYDLETAVEAIKRGLSSGGPYVIVARRLCAVLARRRGLVKKPARVNPSKCVGCGICLKETGCPAITIEGGKARIDPYLCNGCPLCAQLCPTGAIEPGGWEE